MKVLWCSLMAVLIIRQATAGIVRKPPAFATPVYSDSYLPAAMQVIFHAVEQLKLLQSEEMLLMQSTVKPTPTTQSMKHQQPQPTTPGATFVISSVATATVHSSKTTTTSQLSTSPPATEVSSHGSSATCDNLTESAQHMDTSSVSTSGGYEESAEVNEETVEANYATPETNHESPESVQETQVPNQEVPEVSEEAATTGSTFSETPEMGSSSNDATTGSTFSETSEMGSSSNDTTTPQPSTQTTVAKMPDDSRRKEPTIDSIVDEIYVIVKPTTSPLIDDSNVTDESKGAIEKEESIEDELEETRFTLLGEKVAQVPRPSLNSYLRRTKVPPSRALQQLANLYDALSKDARKQGFARYTGYSDEVLKTLQTSAEGGVGPQLKTLLKKVVERNELTRDDAKSRTAEMLKDLDNTASELNKDLRRLLPLRYT